MLGAPCTQVRFVSRTGGVSKQTSQKSEGTGTAHGREIKDRGQEDLLCPIGESPRSKMTFVEHQTAHILSSIYNNTCAVKRLAMAIFTSADKHGMA